MPDEIDNQLELDAILDKTRLDEVKRRAAAIPEGYAGDCEYCGHYSKRLVGQACAPCRDRYKLP